MHLHEKVAKLENDFRQLQTEHDALLNERDSWQRQYETITRVGATVGDGLVIYGNHDAVKRVQTFILAASEHPIEKEDVNRQLVKDLQEAEAKLFNVRTELAEYTGEASPKIGDLNLTARDEIAFAVEVFADRLKQKLWRAEDKYDWNGHWKRDSWNIELNENLAEHIEKGDPLDVAAYCMFAVFHNWRVGPRQRAKMDDAELELRADAIAAWMSSGTFVSFEDFKRNVTNVLREVRDTTKDEVRCVGCGSTMTDEQVNTWRAETGKLSCCPERRALNIDQWRERSDRFEIRYERYGSIMADTVVRLARMASDFKGLSNKRGQDVGFSIDKLRHNIVAARDKANSDE